MKPQTTLLQFIGIVIAIIPIKNYSQIAVTNVSEIAKIKSGTTFFAMNNTASPKAAAYVDAIKKNWTLSCCGSLTATGRRPKLARGEANRMGGGK
jgi:hypothetical protein